ncbi:glycosyltransferase family 2 protein [Coralliovum pocilloporae]|uniref:glycosyltransferase family 2 protein n=1 Tax=Coralliovum pocilloporae TaxID=3066369 RepID=UPI003306A94C
MSEAEAQGLTLSDYLKSHLALNDEECCQVLADYLGIAILDHLHPAQLAQPQGLAPDRLIPHAHSLRTRDGMTLVSITMPGLRKLKALCDRSPGIRNRIAAINVRTLRESLSQVYTLRLAREATTYLHKRDAALSALHVMTPAQAYLCIAGLAVLLLLGWSIPSVLLVGLNALLAFTFLSVALLRLDAAASISRTSGPAETDPEAAYLPSDQCPTYTILVPLYREAEMVSGLIDTLRALDYPGHKLDIKFLLEADDRETYLALQKHRHRLDFESHRIAGSGPRTKPKALNVGLQMARGTYVVVYDAEDRPDPDQLKKAVTAFNAAGSKLACLQARLDIRNSRDSWLAKQFTIEYAALFHGLLPDLSHHGLPLPLGGTSNHFRRDILVAVGGWDPHNVTEDADLGMRLFRLGYDCRTLASSTLEDAPTTLMPWLKQRARWFKGWMQTWLVHMRRPLATKRNMGFAGFLFFQIMIGGMLLAAFIHPFFIFALGYALYELGSVSTKNIAELSLFFLNTINLFVGYGAAMLLAYRTLPRAHPDLNRQAIFGLPVYWVLMSAGAYLALWDLVTRPHHWHKTPHQSSGVKTEDQTDPALVHREQK